MNFRVILILVGISLVLILADYFKITYPIRGLVSNISEPIQIGFHRLERGVMVELGTIFEIGRIRDKNRDLEYEVATLRAENAKLRELEEENTILRDQIGSKVKDTKLTTALTIGYSQIGSSKYLMIDKGSNDGITKDRLVVVKDILIGKIDSVTPSSANIMLTTHPDFKFPCKTNLNARGLCVGEFGSEVRLTKLLPEDKVEAGNDVFSSGESGVREGLVVGKITKVIKSDQQIFQEALITPLLNPDKLELVFVLE